MLAEKIQKKFSKLRLIGKKIDTNPKEIVTSKEVINIISRLPDASLYPFVATSRKVKKIAANKKINYCLINNKVVSIK